MEDKQGMYWHVHHKQLVEWCYSYGTRVECILQTKPASEHAVRLALFQPVQGVLPGEVVEAGKALGLAGLEVRWSQGFWGKPSDAAWGRCVRAHAAYLQTVENNSTAVLALHALECPNCPWDGVSIFPEVAVI